MRVRRISALKKWVNSRYAAVDVLNARYDKGKVFSAAQGLGARSWHMKRQKLSRRPTTWWDELMTVR